MKYKFNQLHLHLRKLFYRNCHNFPFPRYSIFLTHLHPFQDHFFLHFSQSLVFFLQSSSFLLHSRFLYPYSSTASFPSYLHIFPFPSSSFSPFPCSFCVFQPLHFRILIFTYSFTHLFIC